ncbi:plasmid maintenance protein [Borrelia hispanica]|uniref:plasmid maintenance protein n=1 Tax=Borrelia hispanica TaxID=40835 RepID=UPI000464FAE7
MRGISIHIERHQCELIALMLIIFYINNQFRKYYQNRVFYYFNENLKRNGQKVIKSKILQNYFCKLSKTLQLIENPYNHILLLKATCMMV